MWHHQPEDTEPYVGFVYVITENDTGMVYYGIKKFHKRIKRQPLKGKKRKRICFVESDWRSYNSSSPIMQQKILDNPRNYHKDIIKLCTSVTQMKAYEAYYQLSHYVKGDWKSLYNEVINLRLRIR